MAHINWRSENCFTSTPQTASLTAQRMYTKHKKYSNRFALFFITRFHCHERIASTIELQLQGSVPKWVNSFAIRTA